jgi:DNA (cytosine-5)-methyltransferase 1
MGDGSRIFYQRGPIEDGEPTRNGETFDRWIDALHGHGYSVDWQTLNAADYGDATSRERLFIFATRDGAPSFPDPTHSETGDGDTEPWRPAADIINWSDPGDSIWTRDLENPCVQPLKNSMMEQIAEGIRRHCAGRLEPLADALADIGRDDVKRLRENPVPAWLAPYAAWELEEPFLVKRPTGIDREAIPSLAKFYGTSTVTGIEAPIGTIPSGGNKYGLCIPSLINQHQSACPTAIAAMPVPTVTTTSRGMGVASPYLLRQHSGGVPAAVNSEPLPTITSDGAIQKVEPEPLVMPRNGAYRGLHSNPLYKPSSRPLHTVTAKNTDGYLITPSLIRYSHGGATLSVDTPMPTIVTERGGVFSVSNPEPYLCPMYNGRTGQRPRTRVLDRPLLTIPTSKRPAGLASPELVPFLDDCQGPPLATAIPLGTQTATEKYALVVPEHYPWGLDVTYRMLQPHELKQAQGFPEDYEIAGTKPERTEQIGNAVPVTLAKALVESLLTDALSTLMDYVESDTAAVDGTSGASAQGAVSDD